jgi:spore maturation protein SpmB
MVFRAQLGAANPSDIFIPILLATFFSTLVGLVSVAIYQRINLFDKVILAYIGGLTLLVFGIIFYFSGLPKDQINQISSIASNIILFSIIIFFILLGLRKKINIYETFIEGAKEGFGVAIKIIPCLIAILVDIGAFRASGAMEMVVEGIRNGFAALNIDTSFVDALPTAFMKPLSGSGARGMMVDAMRTFGADSFVGRCACIVQGSADTTFYILAVYFGSVGIKKTRYALGCGLLADFAGIVAAIAMAYLFFG